MTKADSTYQNSKVQLPLGADRLSIDSDGYFDFFGTTVSGQDLKNQLAFACLPSIIANSAGAGSGVLSVINLPNVGLIIFSMGDACSNASAWLCSGVKAGQRMIILMRGVGSTGSVKISTSGVTINDTRCSNISIRNSVDSMAVIELIGIDDEKWAVVSTLGGVTLADGI